jgi:hypothetical protein
MGDDERRIAETRRRLETGDHDLARDLAALDERAEFVKRSRLARRRRIMMAGCVAATGLAAVIVTAMTLSTSSSDGPQAVSTGAAVGGELVQRAREIGPMASPAPRALAESERRKIFREIVLVRDRAEIASQRTAPHGGPLTARERMERAKRHHARFEQLAAEHRRHLDDELMRRYGVEPEDIAQIEREGKIGAWEADVPVPASPRKTSPPRFRGPRGRGSVQVAADSVPFQSP